MATNTNPGTLSSQAFDTTFQNFVGRAPSEQERSSLMGVDDAMLPTQLQSIKTKEAASAASASAAASMNPATNPVTSSAAPRADIADFKSVTADIDRMINDSGTSNFIKGALEAKPYSETDAGRSDLEAVRQKLRSVGVLSQDELSQVELAGQTAGAQFDPLIGEAREQKKAGSAKALVGAGQRGGLMSTQFAGISALMPTEGGTYFGQGGELQNIQSAYDRNIQDLESKKVMAINAAKAAARQAIITGKRQDADIAKELFTQAKTAHDESLALSMEKINVLSKVQDIQQNQQKFIREKQDQYFTDLSNIASVGGDVPPGISSELDGIYGKGFTDKYVAVAKAQKEQASEANAMKNAEDLLDLRLKLPQDQVLKIGDVEYTGLQQIDPKKELFVTTETAADGTVTQVTTKFNQDSGKMEIISVLPLGKIGKGFKSGGTGSGAASFGGKVIKSRTPLYDQTTNKYVGDEIIFKDGTKQFVDPTGTGSPNTDIANTRRGNAVVQQDEGPLQLSGE